MRSLNEFEKSLLSKHPHFYETLEIAAREKARFLNQPDVTSLPNWTTEQLNKAKVLSLKILKSEKSSPLFEPKEFAKTFLQFHTANDIDQNQVSQNENLNCTNVVVIYMIGENGDFGTYLDDVFKLLSA